MENDTKYELRTRKSIKETFLSHGIDVTKMSLLGREREGPPDPDRSIQPLERCAKRQYPIRPTKQSTT
jgi:hypothetical protein